jgi:hypothetical protein
VTDTLRLVAAKPDHLDELDKLIAEADRHIVGVDIKEVALDAI